MRTPDTEKGQWVWFCLLAENSNSRRHTRDAVDDFKISIVLPSPVEAAALPDGDALILLVNAGVPAAGLRKFNDAALDALTLLRLRVRRRRAIRGSESRGPVQAVAADDAADLRGRVRDLSGRRGPWRRSPRRSPGPPS